MGYGSVQSEIDGVLIKNKVSPDTSPRLEGVLHSAHKKEGHGSKIYLAWEKVV